MHNKTKLFLSTLVASAMIVSTTGCDKKEDEKTTIEPEVTVAAVAATSTTTTTTAATTTTEVTTEETTVTEVTTTVTTAKPLKSSIGKNYLDEKYVETFSIRPDMKNKVLDVTLNITGTPNVSVKSTTTVKGNTIAMSEVATSVDGDKVYNTYITFFPTKFLVQNGGKTFIINDNDNFYVDVTDVEEVDTSSLSSADIQYNYTLTSDTADVVMLNDIRYIRMQARDNNNNLNLILYFDENGVLQYIYSLDTMFGEAITYLEYTNVDATYFTIPSSYKEYSYEQYTDYINSIRQSIGFNPVTTAATTWQEPSVEIDTTSTPE